MAFNIPTQFSYPEYVSVTGEHLQSFLVKDSKNNLRWRKDSADRIHGGARRTFLPYARNPIDRILFGGSDRFRKVANLCISAANALMQDVVDDAWSGNRVVINEMPPGESLTEHTDPLHFQNGAVVIGVGEADFSYRHDGKVHTLEDPFESLMYVPPDVSHWVENGESERFSIVVAHDMQLAAGQFLVNRLK